MSALYNIPSVPHYIPPPPPSFKCGNFSMPTPPPGINIQINNCTGAYTGYIYQLYRGGAQGISTVQRVCTGYIDCTGACTGNTDSTGVCTGFIDCTGACTGYIDCTGACTGYIDVTGACTRVYSIVQGYALGLST